MSVKNWALGAILILSIILTFGCATKNETTTTPSNENTLQNLCDIGPDFVNTSEQKNYTCEENHSCQWKLLGGKLESQYACCPKDLMNFPGKTIDQYFSRCFIVVD